MIEIFSAGCPVCEDVVKRIKNSACSSCEITVHDMSDARIAARANHLGIASVPAVAIDGALVDCCKSRGVDLEELAAAGLGQPMA